jgi:hypothetical protein
VIAGSQRRRRGRSIALSIVCAGALWPALVGVAWAQPAGTDQPAPPAPPAATAQAPTPAAAVQDAPAEPYVDRVIEGLPALPDLADDDTANFDRSGPPRALRAESRAQTSSNDQGRQSSAWVSLRGALDTANYGAFSFDASGRLLERSSAGRRGPGASFSLYQAAMPFAGGWAASQGLGVIQTLGPRLGYQSGSFFVPTRLIQGASTQWRNEGSGLTLQLSGGETGSFSSIGQGSFFRSGNRVAALGAELQGGAASPLPAGWAYAGALSGASGSTGQLVPGLGGRSSEAASRATSHSLRWEEDGASLHGHWIASRNEDLAALARGVAGGAQRWHSGAWVDGVLPDGEVVHRAGAHRLEPNLSWLGSTLGANSEGGYYRWSRLGLRDQFDIQLSATQPVEPSTGGARLQQAGVSVRHALDTSLGVGGVVQLSHGAGTAWLSSGFAELRRAWADVRVQLGVDTLDGRVVARRLSSDQAWGLPIGQRLSTSVALNSARDGAQNARGTPASEFGTTLELAVAVGTDLTERWSFDLNGRTNTPLSSEAVRVYNLSASSQWRLARGWSLGGAVGWSRASGLPSQATATPIPPLPGATGLSTAPTATARDLWVTLRYDFQAGSAQLPIGAGARIGAGGGSIEGVVYLDDNANGRLDALEQRAANVSVTLDGRYTTRTDAQGRFEFPFVAPGAHRISVASDTLPLPWLMAVGGEPLRVEVAPRESTRLEIGATREGSAPSGAGPAVKTP